MTRGVSAAAKAYAGPIFWLAEITSIEGVTYYFWDGKGDKTISGHTYLPYLQINSAFRRTRSLEVDSGEISLDNTDLFVESLLLDTATFDGALCVVSEYSFGIDAIVEIMSGRLTNQERRAESVAYRLESRFNPSIVDALPMSFSPLCRWRFKKAPCGYTGTEYTACAKTYDDCVLRARTHRFSGVPTISVELTSLYGSGYEEY
jgi:hypothetical protein